MSAIDRVMTAYTRKHTINEAQAVLVRAEISKFIQELSEGDVLGDGLKKDETGKRPADVRGVG